MRYPQTVDPAVRAKAITAKTADPLDQINLYKMTWRRAENQIYCFVAPPEVTGVDAPQSHPLAQPDVVHLGRAAGKSGGELDGQKDAGWWPARQGMVREIDKLIEEQS